MQHTHTPTPQETLEAVTKSFKGYFPKDPTPDLIRSESQEQEAVVPRHVWITLMRFRSGTSMPVIMSETGYKKGMAYRCIDQVLGRLRVDTDFAARIWEAEKILLGIK